MEFEILETRRLILKMVTPGMFAQLFKNYPKDEVKEILGLSTDAEYLTEKQKSDGGYTTYNRSILAFLLVLRENGRTIGRCGFHNWYKDHRRAELGYHLYEEQHKKQGYMSEAVAAILRYGFDVMQLNRVEAMIGPDNTASQNVVKKYGFTLEGCLRQHFIRDGEIHDSLVFALLSEEYYS